MRYVLDASVAVAAVRPNEPTHAAARARVAGVLQGVDQLVVPVLFRIEVAAALARAGWSAASIDGYVDTLTRPPCELVMLGPKRARRIQRTAVQTRLRAADTCYVWLASREAVPLVTSDREVLLRGAALCLVLPP